MKKITLIFLMLTCIGSSVFGQSENRIESRTEKHFNSDDIKALKLDNMFGNITITPSDGKTIDILVEISAEDTDNKRNREFLDAVKIDFSQNGNTLIIATAPFSKKISFWKSLKNFSIDYTIKMPAATNLSVISSFGDIKIAEISGTLDLNMHHGDIFIGNASSNHSKLDMHFGDLRIDAVNQLQLAMQHGDIKIGKANNIDMNVQFGDSKIDLLSGACNINSMHGNVTIKKLSSKLQSLAIDVQFSDLSIHDFADGHYAVDMNGDFLNYSWDKAWLVRSKNSGMNSHSFNLETPNGTGEATKISIKASHSDVNLN